MISVYIFSHKSQTFAIQSNYNITALDLSPNGCLLVASNENGETFMVSMMSQTIVHTYKFNREPAFIKFSPCGKFFAVGCESRGESESDWLFLPRIKGRITTIQMFFLSFQFTFLKHLEGSMGSSTRSSLKEFFKMHMRRKRRLIGHLILVSS